VPVAWTDTEPGPDRPDLDPLAPAFEALRHRAQYSAVLKRHLAWFDAGHISAEVAACRAAVDLVDANMAGRLELAALRRRLEERSDGACRAWAYQILEAEQAGAPMPPAPWRDSGHPKRTYPEDQPRRASLSVREWIFVGLTGGLAMVGLEAVIGWIVASVRVAL
jgi:hypothetical protein